MIGLFGWPQVATAAAFVTAVAVVLNPITPGLPDITVPALFPLDAGRGALAHAAPPSSAGTPAPAAPARTPASAPVAPIGYPAGVAASGATSAAAAPWPGTVPGDIPAPPVPTIAAPPQGPVEIISLPKGFETDLPVQVPVLQIADPPAAIPLTGNRPRTQIARQTVVALPSANRPLPAAAVDPETATPGQPEAPGSPGVQARGRVPASSAGPAVRGHRGPVQND